MEIISQEEALKLIEKVRKEFGINYFDKGYLLNEAEDEIKKAGCYRWNPLHSLDSIKEIMKSLNLSEDVIKLFWFNANWNGKDVPEENLMPLEEDGTYKKQIRTLDWIPEQNLDELNLLVHLYEFEYMNDGVFASEPLTIKGGNQTIELHNTLGWFAEVLMAYFRNVTPYLLQDYPSLDSAKEAYRIAIKRPKGKRPDNRVNAVVWNFFALCSGESGKATKELLFAITDYLRLMGLEDLDTDNVKARISNFKKMDAKPRISSK